MQPDEYRRMAQLQDRHWWFAAKRGVVREAMRALGLARRRRGSVAAAAEPESTEGRGAQAGWALDAGCGTGAMLRALGVRDRVVGVDTHLEPLRATEQGRVVAAALAELPFESGRFTTIGCFDVLYHREVDDVARALDEMGRVCSPGGTLLITDSAFPFLHGEHDRAHHGARRFRRPQLLRLVASAGFEPLHSSYFHTAIFPAVAVLRISRRLLGQRSRPLAHDDTPASDHRSDLQPAPDWLNGLMGAVYRVEAWLAARYRLPFGLSLLVVARRKTTA